MASELLLGLPVRVQVNCVPQGWVEGWEVEIEATGHHFGPAPFVKVELTDEGWALLKEFSPSKHAARMPQVLWWSQEGVEFL